MSVKNKMNTGLQVTLCSALLCSPLFAHAEGEGAVESLTGVNVNSLNDWGIEVGGWVSAGIAGNPDGPKDNFNGPVTFNDRANEFHMNQLYGYIERAVNTEGSNWDFGFRADVMYGNDARFTTQANFDDNLVPDGTSRFYKLAFPQVYAEIFAPIGNGITAKIGHFYTLIGNEVVTAPDNFFYSHAYTMQYGEPFTHTGALFTYPVNKNISVTGGVVSGWDSFFQEPANFLGSTTYTTDNEKTSVTVAYVAGDSTLLDRSDNNGIQIQEHRSMYSIVVNHEIMEGLNYTLQHDYGTQERANADGSAAVWYGINQYLTYAVNDQVSTGLRFEWFRDEDGVRVGPLFGGNVAPSDANHYFALTAGVNYTPTSWLTLRPEVRYDWVDQGRVFDDASEKDQVLISADAIIRF
ncbi:porin [Methylicorpusculum sp.]|uniref:porin n=1 Tax=Methylicorpusculum sp. TaxID=2713644 RepID=UPI00272F617A|nr:porin [Methylicorpusculum sp.]MDP2179832.1 porin [Methylicorpusculum sp.]MDP3528519.1 porin [Methylicorpusculum sp.]MDZ4151639.1 porin [Methylicorpusculum sp.]